jgi:hypothetical protein
MIFCARPAGKFHIGRRVPFNIFLSVMPWITKPQPFIKNKDIEHDNNENKIEKIVGD